jgi:quercetin dioxygenase-like cupin family protein
VEKFLNPMFLFDAVFPFFAAFVFCCWMLWDLRKENKAAEARKAALAVLQSQRAAARGTPTAAGGIHFPAPPLPPPPPAASTRRVGGTVTLPATVAAFPVPSGSESMTDVRKLAWDDMAVEELTPLIGRRLIYTPQQMLAHVYLKQGAIVPAHDHVNEQITYILSGALRFWIGEHADAPGNTYVDVRAGEVLVIPSHVRHRAEALEDTLDVDIFNPPRQDWIDKSDDYLRTGRPMGNVPGQETR